MYEPGFNQGGYEARVKQKQKESVIAVAEPDAKPAEDYNEKIAGELFKKTCRRLPSNCWNPEPESG